MLINGCRLRFAESAMAELSVTAQAPGRRSASLRANQSLELDNFPIITATSCCIIREILRSARPLGF